MLGQQGVVPGAVVLQGIFHVRQGVAMWHTGAAASQRARGYPHEMPQAMALRRFAIRWCKSLIQVERRQWTTLSAVHQGERERRHAARQGARGSRPTDVERRPASTQTQRVAQLSFASR